MGTDTSEALLTRRASRRGEGVSPPDMPCPACGEDVCPLDREIRGGTVLGGYCVEEAIGCGGMATVYRARREGDGEPVALKVFNTETDADALFARHSLREIRLHARIRHRHLVRALGAGQQGGVLFLAMEFMPGGSMHRRTVMEGPATEPSARRMALCVASALQYAWDVHGLVHRDVKPANVLLGSRGEPRLGDLGLARVRGDILDADRADPAIGTLNYTPPEQAAGKDSVDARTDMYGLGATLYTVLTGRIPFDAETVEESIRRYRVDGLEDPRRFHPALSDAMARLLRRLMSVRPEHRFESWDAVQRAIEASEAGYRDPPHPGPSMLRLD